MEYLEIFQFEVAVSEWSRKNTWAGYQIKNEFQQKLSSHYPLCRALPEFVIECLCSYWISTFQLHSWCYPGFFLVLHVLFCLLETETDGWSRKNWDKDRQTKLKCQFHAQLGSATMGGNGARQHLGSLKHLKNAISWCEGTASLETWTVWDLMTKQISTGLPLDSGGSMTQHS